MFGMVIALLIDLNSRGKKQTFSITKLKNIMYE